MPEIIVIGAGISGLTAAYKLAKAGKDVAVLESSDKAGGKIQTERIDGFLLEAGPNSLRVENQESLDLIEELGLSSRSIEASPNAKKRFILKNGNWVKVPANPKEAITTSLFSILAKLRVALEPFLSRTPFPDESVSTFISRRLGTEVYEYAANPFITGIYAGDPSKLSMRYAFPSMWNAEQQHGSLIRGLVKARKNRLASKVKPKVISFSEGLSELTSTLRNELKDRIEFHNGAIRLERTSSGFVITSSSRAIDAKSVICSLPAYETAEIISPISSILSTTLRAIDYPPVAVAYLGFRNDQFEKIPEGFGGLIPSKEHRNILGIIFSSSNFPNRAPEGHSLLTAILGGACSRGLAQKSGEEILKIARDEITELLRPKGSPVFQHLRVWTQAIPQYNVGYGDVLSALYKAENENPGLYFIGNYRGGIAMGACIRNATELARKLV